MAPTIVRVVIIKTPKLGFFRCFRDPDPGP